VLLKPERVIAADTLCRITVGCAVGTAVGAAVGAVVGAAVGLAVGEAVGLAVGDAVGLAVGLAVGDAVGLAVGASVSSTGTACVIVTIETASSGSVSSRVITAIAWVSTPFSDASFCTLATMEPSVAAAVMETWRAFAAVSSSDADWTSNLISRRATVGAAVGAEVAPRRPTLKIEG
jgi:hypothetical protein